MVGNRPQAARGIVQRRAAARRRGAGAGDGLALILADEPTGNLDTGNTTTITAWFLSLAEKYGKTVIMASDEPKAMEKRQKITCAMGILSKTRG